MIAHAPFQVRRRSVALAALLALASSAPAVAQTQLYLLTSGADDHPESGMPALGLVDAGTPRSRVRAASFGSTSTASRSSRPRRSRMRAVRPSGRAPHPMATSCCGVDRASKPGAVSRQPVRHRPPAASHAVCRQRPVLRAADRSPVGDARLPRPVTGGVTVAEPGPPIRCLHRRAHSRSCRVGAAMDDVCPTGASIRRACWWSTAPTGT